MKTRSHSLKMKVNPATASLIALLCAVHLVQPALAQSFDFAYRVTDTRINVFDDGKQTRLQLPEGMQMPVILSRSPEGEKIITPRRDGVYVLLDGVYSQVKLAWANGRQTHIQYTGELSQEERQGRAASFAASAAVATAAAVASPAPSRGISPGQAAAAALNASKLQTPIVEPAQQVSSTPASSVPGTPNIQVQTPAAASNSTPLAVATQASGAPAAAPAVTYSIKTRDTVRETIAAWSKAAGWTHLPEHYTVDFDIQILGDVREPYTDFKTAVRSLLDSTSMTSRSLQPCFYTNQVVRVILKSQRCDQV